MSIEILILVSFLCLLENILNRLGAHVQSSAEISANPLDII